MTETSPHRLLRKGIEEEVYTGTATGDVIGLSDRIAADLPGFSTEPDARNVEYTTAPYRDYDTLIDRLMAKRCRLRRYLAELGDYTLVPGGTLSLETSDRFHISNSDNAYYRYIRDTYGVLVVTASTHINIGIPNPEPLLRAYRVLRCEAPLYLALTASSPFLRGEVTGYHSTRWHSFPETPTSIPFFDSHDAFRVWVERQLEIGTMYNPRHLWLSVRPNGPATPYDLTRLELRVCDRISSPDMLRGVTAMFEARVWQVLEDPSLEPLESEGVPADELIELCRRNESEAARSSLEASYIDWRTGKSRVVGELIAEMLDQLGDTAERHRLTEHLEPVRRRLVEGNLAMQWLSQVAAGETPRQALTRAIRELTAEDKRYDPTCPLPI